MIMLYEINATKQCNTVETQGDLITVLVIDGGGGYNG